MTLPRLSPVDALNPIHVVDVQRDFCWADRMTAMVIRNTNASFESINTDGDFGTVDEAYRAGLASALAIAVEEVNGGADSAIVEVSVDVPGERYAARGAVAISTSRILKPTVF